MTRLKRRAALAVTAALLVMGIQGASVAAASWEAGNPDQPNVWTYVSPSSNLGESTSATVAGQGHNTTEQGALVICTWTDPDNEECGWDSLGTFTPVYGGWGPVTVTIPRSFAVAGQYGPGRTVDCRTSGCHISTYAGNILGGHSLSFAP